MVKYVNKNQNGVKGVFKMNELKKISTAQMVEELCSRKNELFACFTSDESTCGVLIPHQKISEKLPIGSTIIIIKGSLDFD